MSTRVLSLLLTLSLLWSAFMAAGLGVQTAWAAPASQTQQVASLGFEQAVSAQNVARVASGPSDAALPDDHGGLPAEGSFGEPLSQGLLEAAAEPVALFSSHPEMPTPPLTMARPRALAAAAWPAPDLDGPKRPPRPTTLVG